MTRRFVVGVLIAGFMSETTTAQKVYWWQWDYATGPSLRRANVDGSEEEEIINDQAPNCCGQVLSFAVDQRHGMVYWVDIGQIRRLPIRVPDGSTPATRSDLEIIIDLPDSDPRALSIDARNEKLYWIEHGTHNIMRANPDGTGIEVFHQTDELTTDSFTSWLFTVVAEEDAVIPAVGNTGLGLMLVVLVGVGTWIIQKRKVLQVEC